MRQLALAFLLGVLFSACAPGAFGPPPGSGTYQVGPYPATPRAAEPGGDGVYAFLGPDGLSFGLKAAPWRGELVGVGGPMGGAKLRGAWVRDRYALAAEAVYLAYTTEVYDGNNPPRTVYHQGLGLAADVSYLWPVPAGHGSAYAGPRARAYWGFEKTGDGPLRSAHAGVLPGVVLGVNLPVPATGDRLTFGLEAALFMVSPWLTSEAEWSAFSPFALTLSYRF